MTLLLFVLALGVTLAVMGLLQLPNTTRATVYELLGLALTGIAFVLSV